MQIRNIRRFVYRQLVLPPEYQQRLNRVKQIIQEFTFHKPSSEVTLMCLIDEFLNLYEGKTHTDPKSASPGTDGGAINEHETTEEVD